MSAMSEPPDCAVRVVVRVRPLSEGERSAGREAIVCAQPERKEIAIRAGALVGDGGSGAGGSSGGASGGGASTGGGGSGGGGGQRTFTFDETYGEASTQADVYASAAAPIVESVLAGFNGTIFACE